MATLTFDSLRSMAGKELGVSSWTTVDQAMIDAFAETTGDRQWIHVDVERATRDGPFGAPIAHGYLTLSLVASMGQSMGIRPSDTRAAINYGLDKVRFLNPVRAGARIRMRVTLVSLEPKGTGQFLMKCSNTVEIEGEGKAALIAETLVMLIANTGTTSG